MVITIRGKCLKNVIGILQFVYQLLQSYNKFGYTQNISTLSKKFEFSY